jgi:predicted small secreted protein
VTNVAAMKFVAAILLLIALALSACQTPQMKAK